MYINIYVHVCMCAYIYIYIYITNYKIYLLSEIILKTSASEIL